MKQTSKYFFIVGFLLEPSYIKHQYEPQMYVQSTINTTQIEINVINVSATELQSVKLGLTKCATSKQLYYYQIVCLKGQLIFILRV